MSDHKTFSKDDLKLKELEFKKSPDLLDGCVVVILDSEERCLVPGVTATGNTPKFEKPVNSNVFDGKYRVTLSADSADTLVKLRESNAVTIRVNSLVPTSSGNTVKCTLVYMGKTDVKGCSLRFHRITEKLWRSIFKASKSEKWSVRKKCCNSDEDAFKNGNFEDACKRLKDDGDITCSSTTSDSDTTSGDTGLTDGGGTSGGGGWGTGLTDGGGTSGGGGTGLTDGGGTSGGGGTVLTETTSGDWWSQNMWWVITAGVGGGVVLLIIIMLLVM
jgi:hypothetical protein